MTNERRPRRIAVLGGGISGLAAAYGLARAREGGAGIEEFLIEANDRLGGVLRTERVEGFVVEAGPDSFLTEKPEAAALCRELGLGDSLLGSNDRARRTYILHRGRLVPLPEGLLLFIPTRLGSILTTPLLSFSDKLKVAAERFRGRPPAGQASDESAASFVGRHFGKGMVEKIADPLLAGVFGGDSNALSARVALARLWEMEQKYGSLVRGALEARKHKRTEASLRNSSREFPPLFTTLKDGLGRLVEELRKRLAGSRVFLKQRAIALDRASGMAPYTIRCEGGGEHKADAIIFALPAHQCGRLLSSLDPALAESLQAITYAPALTAALGYDAGAGGRLPPGFGFLVPRQEKRRLLACTFVHNKFPHRVPPGGVLLRCFLGGSRDAEVMTLDDGEIVTIVRRELEAILGVTAAPLFYRIYRWPASMPQYAVGHADLVDRIEARLRNHPGLFLAGNAYSGIGLSDCVRTGQAAAEAALKPCPASLKS